MGPRDDPRREAPRSKLTNSTSTDFLVCFPSRTRLPLIPEPVCSPLHHPLSAPHLIRPSLVGLGRSYSAVGLGRTSPLSRSEGDGLASGIAEPTSPRVTCSGQVRVRRSPRTDAEEFGRICGRGKKQSRKKSAGQGSKKDGVQQPPACSRRTWLDLRCFGCSFPESRIAGDARGSEEHRNDKADALGTMFAKWFMVLQQDNCDDDTIGGVVGGKGIIPVVNAPAGDPPPGNTLLSMRCQSIPMRWSGRTKSSHNNYEVGDDGEEEEEGNTTKQKINDDGLVTIKYDSSPSSGVSRKEHGTVNQSGPDPLPRSKSWRI